MNGWAATWLSSMTAFAESMESVPPPGIASRAFTARLSTICSICPGSQSTGHRSGTEVAVSSMSAEDPAQQLLTSAHHGVQVERHRGDDLLASEGKQLACQLGVTLARCADLVDHLRVRR